MKKLFYSLLMPMTLCFGMMFTSCSDDDDDNDGGNGGGSGNGKVSGWVKADNRQVNLKYGYLVSENANDNELYEIIYTNVDMLYYLQHPEKVKADQKYSAVNFEIKSLLSSTEAYAYVDGVLDWPMIAIVEDEDEDPDLFPTTFEFQQRDDQGYVTISFKKNGSNINIDETGFPVVSWKGVDAIEQTTTVDFHFQGAPDDVTSILNGAESYAAGNTVMKVVTDPEEVKLLRKASRMMRK